METTRGNNNKPKANKNSLPQQTWKLNAEFFPMHVPQGSMVKLCILQADKVEWRKTQRNKEGLYNTKYQNYSPRVHALLVICGIHFSPLFVGWRSFAA